MNLDELHDLLDDLASRIDQYITIFSNNEAQTRYSLIDPLLRQLGWDIGDPNQVRIEYRLRHSQGKMDYALFGPADKNKPTVAVEAKPLNENLDRKAVGQAITYCNSDNIPYFVVTDGNTWRIYEVFKREPLPQKVITKFSISTSEESAVMQSLWLWRGNFRALSSPVVPQFDRDPERPHNRHEVTPSREKRTDEIVDMPLELPSHNERIPISEVAPNENKLPAHLVYSDGQEKKVYFWKQLPTYTLEWLVDTKKVDLKDCPIVAGSGRLLVNSKAQSLQGNAWRQRDTHEYKGFWINTNATTEAHVKWVVDIMQVLEIDRNGIRFMST